MLVGGIHILSAPSPSPLCLCSQYDQLEESERRLQTELRRLREHLVAIEDNYTQEALHAEQREAALRERITTEQHLTAER